MRLHRNITQSSVFCDLNIKLKFKYNNFKLYFQLKTWANGLIQKIGDYQLKSSKKGIVKYARRKFRYSQEF